MKVGGYELFYVYWVEMIVYELEMFEICKEVWVLYFMKEYDGLMEIGSLFFDFEYCGGGYGWLLLFFCFFFIVENFECCDK